MKYLFILVILILSCSTVAQEISLKMHKKRSNKIVEINLNRKIKVYTQFGEVFGGRVKEVNDSNIWIDSQLIELDQIVLISAFKKDQTAWGRLWLFLGGSLTTINGIKFHESTGYEAFDYFVGLTMGVAFLTSGIIISSSRKSFFSDKWEFVFKNKKMPSNGEHYEY